MLSGSTKLLFGRANLLFSLNERLQQIPQQVNEIPRDQFLSSSDDDIIEHVQSRVHVDAIRLYEESTEQELEEIQINVSHDPYRALYRRIGPVHIPGVRVTVTIPFSGDTTLWELGPSRGSSVHPEGSIRPPGRDGVGYLDIVFEQPSDAPSENVKQQLDRQLGIIRSFLEGQETDVKRINERIEGIARQAVQARRERLEKQEGIAKLLNIPLKRREGTPEIQPIRVERKLVHPLPPAPKDGYRPQLGIKDADYMYILEIIRHQGRTFESTPKTYAVHDETELRDIILAALNGYFKGSATGETFRGGGKTDIRIEAEDRAAFVAECKIWRGPQQLAEAIDQLLGYLTWRDGKCAIVVFNKHNVRFSELLEKVPQIFRDHPRLHRDIGGQGEGEWRFILTAEEDEVRRIVVHVFLMNLFVAD